MRRGDDISDRWKAVIRAYCTNGFKKKAAYVSVYGEKVTDEATRAGAAQIFTNINFRRALDEKLSELCMSQSEALARLAAQTDSSNLKIAQGALDKILRAHGAYIDRKEISGPGGGPIPLEWED